MTIILGLDIAVHLGVAVWSEGVIVHKGVLHFDTEVKGAKRSDPSRFTRYDRYAAEVEDLLAQWAVTHVYVEGYGYANAHTLVTLVELGTTIRQVLHDNNVQWLEVAPGTLKKFVTGKGQAPKDKMLLEVYKRFGVDCASDDEADAVSLAWFGAAHLGAEVPLPAAQLALARDYTMVATPKKKAKART